YIVERFGAIVGSGNNFSIDYDYCANGNFAFVIGGFGFLERTFHQIDIVKWQNYVQFFSNFKFIKQYYKVTIFLSVLHWYELLLKLRKVLNKLNHSAGSFQKHKPSNFGENNSSIAVSLQGDRKNFKYCSVS